MATDDILSCTVTADGWSCDVVIDGADYAVGASYDFGSLANDPPDLSAPTFVMTVTSEGYTNGSLGTRERTLYGTKAVRLPYPDNATIDEVDSGTTLTVRVALSECVYNDDKNGGAGTSGTDPTVSISAAWCTSGANTSNAATDLAVTNNSTVDYPICASQWAFGHTPAWRGVTAATSIGCIATHGHGIDSVYLSATDEHSNVVSDTVSAITAHQMSASGYYYESYDLAVPISGFTSGDDVTLRFISYPLIGDADSIVDTSAHTTVAEDILGYNEITFRVVSSTTTIYVAATDHPTTPGNNTTGDGSSGTPYATIGKALSVTSEAAGKLTKILVKAGGTTLAILGSETAPFINTGCFVEISPNTGDSVTLNRSGSTHPYHTKVMYSGFTITGNGYLSGYDQSSAKIWFENCTIDPTTPSGAVGLGYNWYGCFFVNNTFSTRDHFGDFSARIGYHHCGNNYQQGGVFTAQAAMIACNGDANGADTLHVGDKYASTAPLTHNLLYINNAFNDCYANGSNVFALGSNDAKSEFAIIGNLIEISAGTQPALSMGGGGDLTLTNGILAHNTFAGGRSLICYNDVGTTAINYTNIFVANNAFQSHNIKTDTFGTPNGNRIGNWAQVYGVNFTDNRYDGSHVYQGEYLGINVDWVTAADTTFGQMGYTDDQSIDGSSGGYGEYLPTGASVLHGHTLKRNYLTYNLFGDTFAASADIGAVQPVGAFKIATITHSYRQRLA